MRYILLLFAVLFGTTYISSQTITVDTLNKYFEQNNAKGSFSLLDVNNNVLITSDSIDFNTPYTPASTFKILNSLIALETGVADDENFLIKWDGKVRNVPGWNNDLYMWEAFRLSAVWYYQEIARRIGAERMKKWVTLANYGNMDASGATDQFWLNGVMKITPSQQMEFLRKLYKDELPFSNRSMNTVKKIMARDTVNGHVIHSKTGWGNDSIEDIGWFVGYTESNYNAYIFVMNIRTQVNTDKNFPQKRIDMTYRILKDMGIL